MHMITVPVMKTALYNQSLFVQQFRSQAVFHHLCSDPYQDQQPFTFLEIWSVKQLSFYKVISTEDSQVIKTKGLSLALCLVLD